MRSHRKAKQQDSRSTISSRKCFSNDFHKCRARNYTHLTRSRKHATQLHKEEMTSRITMKIFLQNNASRFSWRFACRSQSENDVVRQERNADWGHKVYDSEEIYAWIIGLLSTGQIMLKTVLKHELAPATPLMFSKEGDMLMAIQKHVLKDKLQVDVSYRSLQNTSVSMVDLCAILWILEWSVNGVIEEIPENMFKYVMDMLWSEDVCLVVNRYRRYGIKGPSQSQDQRICLIGKNLLYGLCCLLRTRF